jgi:hypothetical protein
MNKPAAAGFLVSSSLLLLYASVKRPFQTAGFPVSSRQEAAELPKNGGKVLLPSYPVGPVAIGYAGHFDDEWQVRFRREILNFLTLIIFLTFVMLFQLFFA